MGNLDETANSTVQNTRKLVSPKGIKQVHQINTAERGVTVTTCCAVTALGTIIPPVMIFPRKTFVCAMMINSYPGSFGLANEKGYMTKETFIEVVKHVIKHTATTKENPFPLLLDNVETHLSLDAILLAKEHGLTLFTFPPHCTHKLDLSLFGPFKTYYDAAINSWLVENPGQSVTIFHLAGCVKNALLQAGSVQNITAGFAKAGIKPFNRHNFSVGDFIMSTVTHRVDPNSNLEVLGIVPVDEVLDSTDPSVNNTSVLDPLPSTSSISDSGHQTASFTGDQPFSQSSSSVSFISPKEFKGLPRAKDTAPKKKPRRKGKCCIAPDTPVKDEVERRQREREEKIKKTKENKRKRAEKKNQKEIPKKKQKVKNVAGKLCFKKGSNESDVNSDIDSDLEPSISECISDSERFPDVSSTQTPVEGDHVLVLYTCKENKYFVGKVIKDVDVGGDVEVSFYRSSMTAKDKLVLPYVPDLCSVNLREIKAILPKPTSHDAATKQQQSYIGFDFDFCSFKLG